jgi:hypothetical protein
MKDYTTCLLRFKPRTTIIEGRYLTTIPVSSLGLENKTLQNVYTIPQRSGLLRGSFFGGKAAGA